MFLGKSDKLYIGAYSENVCAFSSMREAKKVVSSWMVDSSFDGPGYVFVYKGYQFANKFVYLDGDNLDSWDLCDLRRKALSYACRRSVFHGWSYYS